MIRADTFKKVSALFYVVQSNQVCEKSCGLYLMIADGEIAKKKSEFLAVYILIYLPAAAYPQNSDQLFHCIYFKYYTIVAYSEFIPIILALI